MTQKLVDRIEELEQRNQQLTEALQLAASALKFAYFLTPAHKEMADKALYLIKRKAIKTVDQ